MRGSRFSMICKLAAATRARAKTSGDTCRLEEAPSVRDGIDLAFAPVCRIARVPFDRQEQMGGHADDFLMRMPDHAGFHANMVRTRGRGHARPAISDFQPHGSDAGGHLHLALSAG